MEKHELGKAAKNLQSRFPLFGHAIRMAAVKKLASDYSPETIPFLAKALSSFDLKVKEVAAHTIMNLKNQEAIDSFCQSWHHSRENRLEEIVSATKFVAGKPLEVRVSTALKAGRTDLCDTAPSVEYLIKFLTDKDTVISHNAATSLRSMKNQAAIDSFCQSWYHSREKQLDEIVSASKLVAGKPLEIRVATALKAGRTDLCDNTPSIDFLSKFLSDKDAAISQNAIKALRSLKDKEAISFLCEGIINGKLEAAKAIAVETNYLPSQISRRCLFLVITGQIEKYFDLDYEFQYLRTEYQAATDEMQNRIRTVIQQLNDHRLIGLFGEVRKKFVAKDLTEHEIDLMLEVYSRNKQMEEIFALLFFAPLSNVVKVLDVISNSRWEPADVVRQDLIRNLMNVRKLMGENSVFPDTPEVNLGPVFEKWLNEGRGKLYHEKPIEEIQELFLNGNPQESITALSALSSNNLLQAKDHEKAKNHPHWMVRLAYVSLMNYDLEDIFAENPVSFEGGEYWLKKIVPYLIARNLGTIKTASIKPEWQRKLELALNNVSHNSNELKNWMLLLSILSGYTLRNLISIGKYEKQIEDTAISI